MDKVEYFRNMGKAGLPDTHREAIMAVFNEFKDNWYTTKMFADGLHMSQAFAYKICRQMSATRILDRRKMGMVNYYRFHLGDRVD